MEYFLGLANPVRLLSRTMLVVINIIFKKNNIRNKKYLSVQPATSDIILGVPRG